MAGGREKESRQKITATQPEKPGLQGFFTPGYRHPLCVISCLSSNSLSHPAVRRRPENANICGFLSCGGIANLRIPPLLRRVIMQWIKHLFAAALLSVSLLAGAAEPTDAKINLNTASAAELTQVNGIGKAKIGRASCRKLGITG